MAWAFVQDDGNGIDGSGTTIAQAYGSNNTSGNLLVAHLVWWAVEAVETTASLSDTRSNTWTSALAFNEVLAFGLRLRSQVFYVPNCPAGANTVTLTTSATTAGRSLALFEFSGIATSSPLDTSASGTGTSAAPSFNLTGVDAGSLIVGGWWNGQTFTLGSGYTAGPAPEGQNSQYKDSGAGGTVAFNCTHASSAPYVGSAAAFLAAASSTASRPPIHRRAHAGLYMPVNR